MQSVETLTTRRGGGIIINCVMLHAWIGWPNEKTGGHCEPPAVNIDPTCAYLACAATAFSICAFGPGNLHRTIGGVSA